MSIKKKRHAPLLLLLLGNEGKKTEMILLNRGSTKSPEWQEFIISSVFTVTQREGQTTRLRNRGHGAAYEGSVPFRMMRMF